jgi:uncharacterized RmlC-like cupin family protein
MIMKGNGITAPQWRLGLAEQADDDEFLGAQKQHLRPIAGQELCGARDQSAGRVRMPVGGQSVPHHHDEDRTVVVLAGTAATLLMPVGADRWQTAAVTGPGDVIYVPAGWVHQAVNLGGTEVSAIEVSADPVFNRSVHALPELAEQGLIVRLREAFADGRLLPGTHAA